VRRSASGALRLLHYWWPMVLGWSLVQVVGRALGRAPDASGLTALLAGVLAGYSLDRVLDPPRPVAMIPEPDERMRRLLLGVGGLAAIVCGLAALRLPFGSAVAVPTLGAIALLYPRLKRQLPTKLLLLPTVWVLAVVALPFPDGGPLFARRSLAQPVVAVLFLLVAAGCLLCDLKDERADAAASVPSLAVLVGGARAARIAAGLALLGAILAFAIDEPELAVGGALLAVVATRERLLAVDVLGPLLVDVLLSLPGILVAWRAG
jgi:4-hydroxybenzoate polyprenyltransferase